MRGDQPTSVFVRTGPLGGPVQVYVLDRVKTLRLTDEHFEPPKEFDLHAFTRHNFKVLHDERHSVEMRFSRPVSVPDSRWGGRSRARSLKAGEGDMTDRGLPIPVERIERAILLIRGQKDMLDADLAMLYGVTTKALNQAVKRNRDRFPSDFMFELRPEEKEEVVTICDHLSRLRFSYALPHAFTEHGVLMLANVLNSERAVRVSVQIIRAFVRLRETVAAHADLARKLVEMERKYDAQFKVVFDAIRALMKPPAKPVRKIGFEVKEAGAKYGKRLEAKSR